MYKHIQQNATTVYYLGFYFKNSTCFGLSPGPSSGHTSWRRTFWNFPDPSSSGKVQIKNGGQENIGQLSSVMVAERDKKREGG
jgi:hypothetical protein